jgi:hypothetical protein
VIGSRKIPTPANQRAVPVQTVRLHHKETKTPLYLELADY